MTTAHRPFWYLRRRAEDVRSEIDEELRLHLDMRTDALVAHGMSVEEARREALRQFGDLPGTRKYCRRQDEEREHRMQRALWIEDLLQDLRIALRSTSWSIDRSRVRDRSGCSSRRSRQSRCCCR
jgi:hypothetical protein